MTSPNFARAMTVLGREHDGRQVLLYAAAGQSDPFAPFLTLSLGKWYGVYQYDPTSGEAAFFDFGALPSQDGESSYIDHVPNPAALLDLARSRRVRLSLLALGAVVHEWDCENNGKVRRAALESRANTPAGSL